jgi:DNA-binding PadR family transcriptional regulator
VVEGTVYTILLRLERQALVQVTRRPSEQGPPRKFYALNDAGRAELGFTGRNLMPILDGVLGLLEETAADGQDVREVLGDDIPGFCAAVAGGEGARSYRDRWREQLNSNVARKLGQGG